MSEIDEGFRELLRRVRQGDEEAAWEVVASYGDAIRRAVRQMLHRRLRPKFDSLDFAQIVWSSFFRVRDQLERFNRPEELAAFLVTTTHNKVGMEIRRRLMTQKFNVNRERPLQEVQSEGGDAGEDVDAAMIDGRPAALDVVIAQEQWERLLQDQPEQYRRIIELRMLGHSPREIADALHVAESTVRRFLERLFQGRVAR